MHDICIQFMKDGRAVLRQFTHFISKILLDHHACALFRIILIILDDCGLLLLPYNKNNSINGNNNKMTAGQTYADFRVLCAWNRYGHHTGILQNQFSNDYLYFGTIGGKCVSKYGIKLTLRGLGFTKNVQKIHQHIGFKQRKGTRDRKRIEQALLEKGGICLQDPIVCVSAN